MDEPYKKIVDLFSSQTDILRIAVLGDLHRHFDQVDVGYFNASDYDLLLFVGDLGELFRPRLALKVAEQLSKLTKPALLIPGNHDTHNFCQVIAEVTGWRWLSWFTALPHPRYHQKLSTKLQPVVMGGYSLHPFTFGCFSFDVICTRPFAMGGSCLNFAPTLHRLYGVRTGKDSIDLLCQQVDASRYNDLVFLAHNGPFGLGDQPTDVWGCDFDPSEGDFGDQDLTAAIEYAKAQGKRVLAVIAGHMHLQTYLGPKPIWQRRGTPGPRRPWHIEKAGVHHINAAQVPRILETKEGSRRHHIALMVNSGEIAVEEVWVEA